MAKAILAGYNIDAQVIDTLLEINNATTNPDSFSQIKNSINPQAVTPETLSAAYARISRSPKPIPELRRQSVAEVEKARKSNRTIIFDLGHSSVAEHAVFNFDILHLSRLGVEFFERFRLASFTEKSQRYITLDGDYVTPQEIKNSEFAEDYHTLIQKQNDTYLALFEKLVPYFRERYPEMAADKRGKTTLEGWAKEDARYALSLATEAQMGMTVNARTLEYMISASQSHPLAEIRDLGSQLFSLVKDIAPSIVKYPHPTPFYQQMETLYHLPVDRPSANSGKVGEYFSVRLLNSETIHEKDILQTLGFSIDQQAFDRNTNFENYQQTLHRIFRQMNAWDAPPRAFEWVDLKFEIILSSSAFAQLKRHRMATLIAQPYHISLGATIPRSIRETALEDRLTHIIDRSGKLYRQIMPELPAAAPYILTNAHRRRVLLKMNLRELYHFVRLRADQHAQWDIRKIAEKLMDVTRNKLPVVSLLLSGKDKFPEALETLE